MSGLLYAATLGTALASGLVAGVFFAFSTFVMRALDDLPAAQGVAAMQSVNRAAITPLFMLALLGTAAACAALIVVAVLGWSEPRAPWLLAGGALYLIGTFMLTIGYHVPLNDALAAVDPHAAEAARRWSDYVGDWTLWNHVRAAAALGGAGLLTVALTAG